MQYFCFDSILLFSKSYPEIESTWSTAKCRWRKSFDTWHYIVLCATLSVSFSSRLKATNVFVKHILKSKEHDQSIQERKKLFCCIIVKNYLCNILCKFLIETGLHWGAKSKKRHPSWLYHTVIGLSEAATGSFL